MAKLGRPPLPLPIEQIRQWASDGWSLAEMAAQLGCSRNGVWKAMRRHEIPRLPAKSRPEHNHFWTGGRTVEKGYILVKSPAHPYKNHLGYVREHRLVMEAKLGRYLLPGEVVDHIDGVKDNNAPENLRLFARNADHLRVTLAGKVPQWSPEGRERTRQAVIQSARLRRRPSHPTLESGGQESS